MASMQLNGQEVPLQIQSQEVIGALALAIVPLLANKHGIVESLGGVLAEGLGKGLAATEPQIQACLWLLHELGVRAMSVKAGAAEGSIDRVLTQEERSRDTSDPYSAGNIATGRAMAFSLANLATRQFRLNGEVRAVKVLPKEVMAPAMQAIVDMRRLNEPIHITSTRALASLLTSGAALDDARVDAVVSLLSDLGVGGISVDAQKTLITFDGLFSEANAAASAYLHGGGSNGVKAARDRIRYLNSQATAKGGAMGATATATATRSPIKGRRRR